MRLSVLICAAMAVVTLSAKADPIADFYKGKTVTALVGVSPGGEYDFQLRLVARHLGKHIPGNPTIVPQNMTGATGLVMANYLARVAPKDGTYIGLIQNGLPTSQAVGLEGVQFDARQFLWLGSVAPSSQTMFTWKDSVKTIEEAKRVEVITGAVGSSGITLSYPMMLNDLVGTKFKMVLGYTGSGAIDLAMERGEVSARASSWASLRNSKPHWIKDKLVNVLVHSGPKPAELAGVPSLDDLITHAEDKQVAQIVTTGDALGHPFATTPGAPAERVEALRKAFAAMLRDPDFIKEADARGLMINPVSAESLTQSVNNALTASEAAKKRARKYFQ